VLVGLYEETERPPNAVDYIKRYMGAPAGVDVEALRRENESLNKLVQEQKQKIEELENATGGATNADE
jgi:predicted RNase H-like nuclease (RuvC/YqgF family)